jgi:hypothetical protein
MGLVVNPGQTGLSYLWQIKALQISNNGLTPVISAANPGAGPGWGWQVNDPSLQVGQDPAARSIWTGTSGATRIALYEGSLRAFLDVVEKFTPQQFYAGGEADPAVAPTPGQQFGAFGDRVWYAIPLFRYFGVNQTLINEFANWAKTVWPLGNWDQTTVASCFPLPGGNITSSTEH